MKNPFSHIGWTETEATVYTCGTQNHYDPGFGQAYIRSDYLVVFSYEVDGHWYSGEFNAGRPWKEGSTFTIRYDPANPERNNYSNSQTFASKVVWWVVGGAAVAVFIWLRNRYFPR